MSMSTVSTPVPVGDTWRGLFGDYFNANNIAREDFNREVQLSQYAHEQNLETLALQNQFNAEEAQKNRDFQTEMSNTQFQRAVEDLKKAGLNPILAYQNLGASVPQGSQATSGSGGSSHSSGYRGRSANTGDFLGGLLRVATTAIMMSAGLYNLSLSKGTHFGFGAKIRK